MKQNLIKYIQTARCTLNLRDEEYVSILLGAAGVDSATQIVTERQFLAVKKVFASLGFQSSPLQYHLQKRAKELLGKDWKTGLQVTVNPALVRVQSISYPIKNCVLSWVFLMVWIGEKVMANELFNFRELVQPLTPDQRLRAVETVVRDALYGLKYVYSMKEVSGILHWSKDMIYDALFYAMIDSLLHKEDKSA